MKVLRLILASAATAVLFASCAKEIDIKEPATPLEEEGVTYHDVDLIAGNEEVKTYLASDGKDGYISKWDSDDQISLFQKNSVDGYRTKISSSAITRSNSDQTAAFTLSLAEVDGASNYKYWPVYPSTVATRSGDDLQLVLPGSQTISDGKFDKAADIMVGRPIERAEYSSDALSTPFARVGTIVKLTLSGLTAGETVKSIVFSTEESGKYLAGTIKYDLTKDELKTGITSGSQSITLTPASTMTVPAGGSLVVWMRTAEVTLTKDFTVVVNTKDATTNYTYTKAVNLSTAGKTVAFKSGRLGTLSVSSLNSGKETVSYNSLLPVGYYVIHETISSSDLALGIGDNSGYREVVSNPFSSDGNGKYNATSNSALLWYLGFDSENNKYSLYNVSEDKYLAASNTGTNLSLVSSGSDHDLFLDTYDDSGKEKYIIYASSSLSNGRHIGYNSSASPVRFASYTGDAATGDYKGIFIFTPAYASPSVKYSNINLATSNEVSDKVTVNPTKFNFTTSITKVGVYSDSGMTVSTDWLTVTVEDASTGELSYTAEANEAATARTAYVKLTASGDNSTSATVSFTVTQPEAGGSGTVYWTKVTDVNDLDIDDEILFIHESSAVAMSTTQGSNNRSAVSISEILDTENNRISDDDVQDASSLQIITLGKSNTHWTFYTGTTYLYAAGSGKGNNYLRSQANNDANGEWTISISSGDATITAQGTNTNNLLRRNGSLFSCYSSGQDLVQIYKYDNPTVKKIKVASTAISDVDAAGVSNATSVSAYTLKNATDSDVTVTKDNTVVTAASIEGGTLTYTVAANTGAARNTGWIKLAVAGGNEVTITVSQLAAKYALTLSATNGSVSASVGGVAKASGSLIEVGSTVTITATPSSGYSFSAWDVYRTGVSATKVSTEAATSPTTFTMPAYAVSATATFEAGAAKTNQVLFHETFGDNTGSARAWNDSYSVKSGVSAVYSGITSYTVSNAKQGKNTTGSTLSGLNQSTQGTDASIIIGPLSVASAENMVLTYQWKAASIKETYTTSLYYKTSSGGSFTEVSGTGTGATTFVTRTYNLPAAAQVSTLYLKIVWNTSNTQAIIDEVNLQGDY